MEGDAGVGFSQDDVVHGLEDDGVVIECGAKRGEGQAGLTGAAAHQQRRAVEARACLGRDRLRAFQQYVIRRSRGV